MMYCKARILEEKTFASYNPVEKPHQVRSKLTSASAFPGSCISFRTIHHNMSHFVELYWHSPGLYILMHWL